MSRRTFHLEKLDHPSIEESAYKHQLKDQQLALIQLQRRLGQEKRSVIIVVEGPDAGGKGGAIKRLVERLDPRTVRVYSIVKPTAEEYRHHYLWRFWTKLPAHGEIAIFDRSWYGRVLVERVESFASKGEWQRAYREINEFERTLAEDGAIIIKLYLHITKDEQLRRFKKREGDPLKHWKITDEDWRNRKKWKQHVAAAHDMFARTSTPLAPWAVVGANYKWHARIRLAQAVAERLQAALDE